MEDILFIKHTLEDRHSKVATTATGERLSPSPGRPIKVYVTRGAQSIEFPPFTLVGQTQKSRENPAQGECKG